MKMVFLNVTAADKSTNKSKNITITNNRGRFTDEQIERMVAEAKEFEEADNKRKAAVDAKNELENYVHSVKQASTEQTQVSLIDEESRSKLDSLISDLSKFVDEHPNEDQGTYEAKRKELEDVWNPIAVKLYAQKTEADNEGAQAQSGDQSGDQPRGPTVEEVD